MMISLGAFGAGHAKKATFQANTRACITGCMTRHPGDLRGFVKWGMAALLAFSVLFAAPGISAVQRQSSVLAGDPIDLPLTNSMTWAAPSHLDPAEAWNSNPAWAAIFPDLEQSPLPLILGLYPSAALQSTAGELRLMDLWLETRGVSSRITIAGTFMDLEFPNPDWNVPHDLDAAWDQGYIPFVNLAAGTTQAGPRSAADIANGLIDPAIHAWAAEFARWAQGGQKRAMLAPLQEMNAGWVSYGLDPEGFKAAYRHIQSIFAAEGVPGESVLWVFAPNGWSEPNHNFEYYYPGDEVVDAVGFSAFNFGSCSSYGDGWDLYEESIAPYITRMQAMAPLKPIFVAQTGTVAEGGDKDAWLRDTLLQLSNEENVAGLIYFNVTKTEAGASACDPVDWRVFDPQSGTGYQGFVDALQTFEPAITETPPSYSIYIPLVMN